jgi:hypothetical protein
MRFEGALAAPRTTRHAHRRRQIQHRPVPLPNAGSWGHPLDHGPKIRIIRGRGGVVEPEIPPVYPSCYPIDRRLPAFERDSSCRRGRVQPHAGELEQALERRRNTAESDDLVSERLQGLGSSNEPQRTDHGPDRVHPCLREGGGMGPSAPELRVHGSDGRAPRTLEEDLGHEDPERVRLVTPRERAAVLPPPPEQAADEPTFLIGSSHIGTIRVPCEPLHRRRTRDRRGS